MSKADDSLDLCSIKTFAEMSGVSVEEAINWADSGAIPSLKLADFRMVNLARLRDDCPG
ncbi:DNA-binding protein OS=Stutzerimonas stutzeri OX=316 GN=CXK91_07935 PE=4 SV=1 [Stutzerimonas stutzeri]